MYELSARYHDLLLGESGRDYLAEAQVIADELRHRLPGATSILHASCATGEHDRHLCPDFAVDGLDRNESFLERARTKNARGAYHFGDMRSFDLGRCYDAILCLSGAMAFLGGPRDLAATLDSFSRHLPVGGLVFLEPFPEPGEGRAWKESPRLAIYTKPPVTYVRLSRLSREGRHATLTEHHLYAEGELVEHFEESARLYLFSRAEIRDCLASRGFASECLPGIMGGNDLWVGAWTGTPGWAG